MRDDTSTIEQLMARQLVRPVLRNSSQDGVNEPHEHGGKGFKPGLRVVAIEDEPDSRRMRRWQDEAAGMTIDA